MDMKVSSTIGFEARHNELLGEEDEDRFVERATAGLAPQPPNFQAIVDLNRGPLVTAGVEVLPLAPRQVEQKRRAGALIVDVRTSLQFDEAHIPGAVAITMLHAGFGTKLAWIADRDEEIVLVGRDDEDGQRAAKLATAVGIRELAGFLAGGMTAWRAEGREVARIERIDVHGLWERTRGDGGVQVLDVRERDEWERSHLEGSIHVPYHDIHSLPEAIDPDAPVAAICTSGQRSAVAASLVARFGAREVLHVAEGGVGTWERAGHPVERGAKAAAPS
jgi:rhodanese-related sulfurtransferase